jgi:hypothetical protein
LATLQRRHTRKLATRAARRTRAIARRQSRHVLLRPNAAGGRATPHTLQRTRSSAPRAARAARLRQRAEQNFAVGRSTTCRWPQHAQLIAVGR